MNELATMPAPLDDYAFLDRVDGIGPTAPSPKKQQPIGDEIHGFYFDMPFAEYAAVDALNASKIVNMRRSAMYYRHACDNPSPETPAMALGTLTHKLVLEPQTVGKIVVWGSLPSQKVRNGGVWEEFKAEHADKTILTVNDYAAVTNMAAAALKNAPIRKYAHAEGPTEVCMFWRNPLTDKRFKARLDKVITDSDTIFDLKTTRDCHSFKFGSQAYALGYHIKLALYTEGYEVLTGVRPSACIGAIDSKPPHESAVYRVTTDVIGQGWDELSSLVARIYECEAQGEWPGEYEQESDLLLPVWSRYSDDSTYDDV